MRAPRTFSEILHAVGAKCITSKASNNGSGFPKSRDEPHRLSRIGLIRWMTQFSSDAPREPSDVPLSDQDHGRGRRAGGGQAVKSRMKPRGPRAGGEQPHDADGAR
jgi:hypothetical protein